MLKRFQLSALFLSACLVASVAIFGLSITPSFFLFCFLYCITGTAGGIIFTSCHTSVSWFFPERRQAVLSFADFSFSAGTLLAPLLINIIMNGNYPWQIFFKAISFANITLAFLMIPLALTFFRSYTVERKVSPSTGEKTSFSLESDATGSKITLINYAIVCFSIGFIEWQQNVWLVTYAMSKGIPQVSANHVISLFSLGMLARRAGSMFAGKSHPEFRLVLLDDIILLGGISTILAGKGTAVLCAGSFAAGFALGGVLPIVMATAMASRPSRAPLLSTIALVMLTAGGLCSGIYTGSVAIYFSPDSALTAGLFVSVLLIISRRAFISALRGHSAACGGTGH
nr:MFS transporter [Pantoea agglomerans]